MTTLVLAALIFTLAGTLQGLTGFGSGLVAIPLLCMIIDVKKAVPLALLNGLVITTFLAFKLRPFMDRKKILPLLSGSIPGILIGASMLKIVDPGWIRVLLGILLFSISCYALHARPKPLNPPRVWGYIAGFFTGFISALLSAGGPPAIIYTTLTSWEKDEIKATLTGFFVASGMVTVLAHIVTGSTTTETVRLFLTTVPFVLLGTSLGSLFSKRINRILYLRIVYCFLAVMGLLMIFG